MQRKLTIAIDDDVYRGLYQTVGRGSISHFIEGLVRPHVVRESSLAALYAEAALDQEAERTAVQWLEASVDEALA